MSNLNQIILSQVTLPAQRSNVLARERVTQLLRAALSYPVSILTAGTGYGKSTSLLSFIEGLDMPVFWFSVSSPDRDPMLFLRSLYTAFNQQGQDLGKEALRKLQNPEAEPTEGLIALINAVSARTPADCLLVIDDFQYINSSAEITQLMDWFIEHLPRSLHVIFSARYPIEFPSLHRWRAKGTVLELGKNDLTFRPAEIEALFRSQYKVELSPAEVDQLQQRTEGWVIGLQMVWQSIRNKPGSSIKAVLEEDSESRSNLFAYLTEEIFSNQSPVHQDFLVKTSVLFFLDSESCDFLLDIQNSIDLLNDFHRAGLFIEQLRPGVFRYHHIFREFLQSRLAQLPELERELNRKIASYFSAHQYWERAVGHLLVVGDYPQINEILENVGAKWIQDGRNESIRYWLSQFPDEERARYPYVNFLWGELNRYAGNFDLALEDYRTAQRLYHMTDNQWGISLAMRGQAQIYLDTIRPINAQQLLTRALYLLDPIESREEISQLYTQLAENQINSGDTSSAAQSLQRARELSGEDRKDNDYIAARLMLRTGRIREGIALLETLDAQTEAEAFTRPQRFHREAALLLSLFYAFNGRLEQSLSYARKGLELSQHFRSSFVRSVGTMRLAHGLQLSRGFEGSQPSLKDIRQYYQDAIQSVDIVRIHVEPLWGMCRLLGFTGEIEAAREVAQQALVIADSAGDKWIGVLVRLSLGASLVLAGRYEEANHELSVAEMVADQVHDPLTRCAAQLWLAKSAWHQGYRSSLWMYLEQALKAIEAEEYSFLLTEVSLLGSDEPADFIPLLIEAQRQGICAEFAERLLFELGVGGLEYHPGYSLHIQTLGGFQVWRGREQLVPADWKREKSRQLLQVLAANPQKWLTRDQISLLLWPEADQSTAANNFKVALSTLNHVLEPERPSGENPFFILRRNDQYMLNPQAGISIDAEVFERLSRSTDLAALERAVRLYRGRYFEDELVQEFYIAEEQYYHERFIRALDRLTEAALERSDFDAALGWVRMLLAQDPLWEPAYRTLMDIHHKMGNQSMVQQSYQQCRQLLSRQLGGGVSEETEQLYQDLIGRA